MTNQKAQLIAEVKEADLTEEDVAEFKAIADAIKDHGIHYSIPNGTAVRQVGEKNVVEVVTAVYPIEHGNRYVKYRIDMTGDEERLVKKEILEDISSI